jgi:3-oxoacyl-[acyl-carrier protein] reductase
MTSAELTSDQLRRDPLPLRGRVAMVTGVSRRAGIGYAIARRLAGLGASLVIHHYAPHDRDQPWGADPGGLEAVIGGVTEALADPDAAVWHQEADLSDPDSPPGSSSRPPQLPDSWTSWSAITPAAAATARSAP